MEQLWGMRKVGGRTGRCATRLWKQFKTIERRSEGILWFRYLPWRTRKLALNYASFFELRALQNDWVSKLMIRADAVEQAPSPSEQFYGVFPTRQMNQLDPFNATRVTTYNQLFSYIIPVQGDRVDMANSVECRTPFMDPDLVDYVSNLAPLYFVDIDRLQEKDILRKAFAHLLPKVVMDVHKHPFLSPNWFDLAMTARGQELVGDFMAPSRIDAVGVFNGGFLKALLRLWRWLPRGVSLWKSLDILVGLVLTSQILHHLFVESSISICADFKMKERGRARFSESPHTQLAGF
jgi:asparagine synthase (glutamine-hydrolysing)